MKRIPIEQIGKALEVLFVSCIQVDFGWTFESGFEWVLGDFRSKSFKALPADIAADIEKADINNRNISDSISALGYAASRMYPGSAFANYYNSLPKF